MSDPYKRSLFEKNPFATAKRRHVTGEMIVVLDGKLDNRGLKLIVPVSRAILEKEIHELILTDEKTAVPGAKVDSIAYIGFFEVKTGGVVAVGDKVLVKGKRIGEIAGFDETHAPNHQNIVIRALERYSGLELTLEPGDEIAIRAE